MEPKDQQINIIYSDNHCYISGEGHLIRKENRLSAERKIADINPDEFEAALKEYQDAYTELWKQAAAEIAGAASAEALDRIAEQLALADVIGDFDAIADLIDKAKNELPTTADEAPGDETGPGKSPDSEVTAESDADESAPIDTTGDDVSEAKAGTATDTDAATNVESSPADAAGETEPAQPVSEEISDTDTAATDDIAPAPDTGKTGETEPAQAVSDENSDTDTAGADDKAPAPDTGKTGETGETAQADEEISDGPVSEEEQYYLDLVSKANDYARQTDWSHIPQLFASIYDSWNEGPELDASRKDALRNRVDKALETFNARKSEHYDHLKEKRQKNLDYRVNLLERLQKIIDQKRWQAAGEVASIRRKWDDIKQLPSGAPLSEQNETFNKLLEVFDEKRVEYLVKVREKEEENLTGKLMIIEKMELVTKKAGPDVENWENLDKEIDELTRQWRKIKHVPKEKEDEVWDRFKIVRDSYYTIKAEHDESYKKDLESNIKSKQRLIRKAVSLNDEKDLAKGVRTINRLHNEWKKIGPVPKELNDKLWDEFKAASDAFNKLKSENIDVIREQENQNYEQKVALCVQAEALADAENFKTAADEMVKLLAEWKKAGPVPRKKTNPVWNRFKKAMDDFYKKRRSFFKDVRVDQKENLEKKREIIGKITALAELEDPSEAIDKVKALQDEYKSIGFVPIKFKDTIWAEYKSALDLIYGKARASHKGSHDEQRPGRAPAPDRGDKRVQQEIFKLRRECDELKSTILNYSDTMTYIKPNKKGLELREQIQNNIDEAEKKIREKQEKIDQLSSEE
ncbi:MAG: DUF349 domain-containing protein [Balneolaceae bacterium]|nr:MAG: DUF349 domain-containing protein [Balneolaceae bacterium]